MPLYLYRCPERHEHERIRPHGERTELSTCPVCGDCAVYVLSAHHAQPDGIYSYEPNIGDPATHERRHAEATERDRRWA